MSRHKCQVKCRDVGVGAWQTALVYIDFQCSIFLLNNSFSYFLTMCIWKYFLFVFLILFFLYILGGTPHSLLFSLGRVSWQLVELLLPPWALQSHIHTWPHSLRDFTIGLAIGPGLWVRLWAVGCGPSKHLNWHGLKGEVAKRDLFQKLQSVAKCA